MSEKKILPFNAVDSEIFSTDKDWEDYQKYSRIAEKEVEEKSKKDAKQPPVSPANKDRGRV